MRIAREALPFVAGAAVAALLAAWWTPWAALPPLVLLAFCLGCWLYFFFHPERIPPPAPY